MASVQRTTTGAGAVRWRARWRTPDGKSREAWFDRKVDAERHLTSVEHKKLRGEYVDPKAGKVTFATFADQWLQAQTFGASSREVVEVRIRLHMLPTFGDVELRSIRPSMVQAWLRGRQEKCSPSYVTVMLSHLSAILGAAVDDGLIARNPCASRSVRAPRRDQDKVVPWPAARVHAVIGAHPVDLRAIPMLAAGAGLRQGETFGLRVQDVDFLRRKIHVRQQVRIVGGNVELAPPKGGKTREVPMADAVGFAISEHLRASQVTDGLLFTHDGQPISRKWFNRHVWAKALERAGVEGGRGTGMHSLRHYYASVLLDGGESIRALAEYLGHNDPGFTLRTYAHVMPASEDRARRAVDAAFRGAVVGLPAATGD